MGIDSSIYANSKVPDFLGDIQKGQAIQQQAYTQNQTQGMDKVFKQAVVTNPDGTTTLDQSKLLSGAAGIGQKAYFDTNKNLRDQAAQKLQQTMAQVQAHGELLNGVVDQKTYDAALQKLAAGGVDVSKEPKTYDEGYVNQHKAMALTAEQNIANQAKQAGIDIDQQNADTKKREVDAKVVENNLKRQELFNNKQNQNVQQTLQLLESARGAPEVAQAGKDLYAAQKFNTGYNLYGDPNKLNPQQSKLLVTEAAKIASGGVPTVDEQRGLNQSTAPSWLASAAQALTNDTSPAKQGAFLKALKDYNDGIAKDAQGVIEDKYGRIINSKRHALSPSDYQNLRSIYIDRFKNSNAQAPGGGPPVDADLTKMTAEQLKQYIETHGK